MAKPTRTRIALILHVQQHGIALVRAAPNDGVFTLPSIDAFDSEHGEEKAVRALLERYRHWLTVERAPAWKGVSVCETARTVTTWHLYSTHGVCHDVTRVGRKIRLCEARGLTQVHFERGIAGLLREHTELLGPRRAPVCPISVLEGARMPDYG